MVEEGMHEKGQLLQKARELFAALTEAAYCRITHSTLS